MVTEICSDLAEKVEEDPQTLSEALLVEMINLAQLEMPWGNPLYNDVWS